ncbi:MAG: hypothetical protein KC613_07745 [Myxococcales bacterium]|nr:hypothetical protein [Myxococcales bacterium]MCB9524179.1 hypothetical protein [Myxococcales bacterium]
MLHTLLALAALALAAPPRPGLQVVPFDRHTTYLIDPVSESCLLSLKGRGLGRVSCRALARNLPDAARHITWITLPRQEAAPVAVDADRWAVALVEQVERLAPHHYAIPRVLFEQALRAPNEVASRVRVLPVHDGEALAGLRLDAVRPGSPAYAVGLRDDDLLRAVNGQALRSASRAVELYRGLQGARRVELLLTRADTPVLLVWELR